MIHTAPYWIQSSDFSSEEFPASVAHEIERALKAHDWATERDRQVALQNSGAEECPAGLGVNHEDGRILHICPDGAGSCMMHYSFFETEKMLGLIPRRKYDAGSLENASMETAARFIAPFLGNDYASVKNEVEAHA